jgi:hypothetical protein
LRCADLAGYAIYAFPVADCQTVYASTGYSASVSNLAQISFATDNVFSDGTTPPVVDSA